MPVSTVIDIYRGVSGYAKQLARSHFKNNVVSASTTNILRLEPEG